MINSVAFFVYPVRDIARSREFYEQVLGLKVETNFGDKWIEYDVAGTTFAITSMDIAHQPGAKGGAVAFEVDDLDAEIARLKIKRVKFVLDTYTTPVCRFIVIADPDDNDVMIHKRHT
jgi:predicted enzyme related to lactoylglutathione lyase